MNFLPVKALSAVAAVALAFLLTTQPARADRAPTPEERARIEQALRSLGFQSWEEIELDDGLWEVDDAKHTDGKEYDLKLDPATLRVVKQTDDN
jgi:Peptidase propeptide and YPEB domain